MATSSKKPQPLECKERIDKLENNTLEIKKGIQDILNILNKEKNNSEASGSTKEKIKRKRKKFGSSKDKTKRKRKKSSSRPSISAGIAPQKRKPARIKFRQPLPCCPTCKNYPKYLKDALAGTGVKDEGGCNGAGGRWIHM